jgi:hypothetical protein
MCDIREDFVDRIFGIVSRCVDAMAQFDERVRKLHEGNCELIADINFEKCAVAGILANENSRRACDIKTGESDARQKVLAHQILPMLSAIQKKIDAIQEKVDAIAAERKPLPFNCMLRVASNGGKESASRAGLENVTKTSDGRDGGADAETMRTLSRYLSGITRPYPWEKVCRDQQRSTRGREPEATAARPAN